MLAEIYPPKDCGKFTQGMIGNRCDCCVPNGLPKCEFVRFARFCGAAESIRPFTRYPVKAAKKERKIIEMTVFILQCGDKIAVQKRGAKGILAGPLPVSESGAEADGGTGDAAGRGMGMHADRIAKAK